MEESLSRQYCLACQTRFAVLQSKLHVLVSLHFRRRSCVHSFGTRDYTVPFIVNTKKKPGDEYAGIHTSSSLRLRIGEMTLRPLSL